MAVSAGPCLVYEVGPFHTRVWQSGEVSCTLNFEHLPVGKQRLEMNCEQCVHKPDLKSLPREIWALALLWTLWGWFSCCCCVKSLLQPFILSCTLGWLVFCRWVGGCWLWCMAAVKRLYVWRKFHGLDLTSTENELWKSLGLSTRKTETLHFPHQMAFNSLTYFSVVKRAKSLSISMPLDPAFYYFWIVLAEARHTCHSWLYNFLSECDYSEKY